MAAITTAAERDFKYGVCYGNHATAGDFDGITWQALGATLIPVEEPIDFKQNVAMRRPFRANTHRVAYYGDTSNDKLGVSPTVGIRCPAVDNILDLFLGSAFQVVTEGAASPFVKNFVLADSAAEAPSFTGNAGCYLTLIKAGQIAANDDDEAICSAICSKLTLSCYPGQHDGRLWIEADMIGRYHQDGQNYTGTMAVPTAYTYYNFADLGGVTIGGDTVTCFGFSVTITTNAKPIPTGGSGTNGTLNFVLPHYEVSGEIDFLYQTEVMDAMNAEDTDTLEQIVIYWGASSTCTSDNEMVIKVNAKFNDDSSQGNEEARRVLKFDGVKGASAEACNIDFANAIDRGTTYAAQFWG
jgi:hypothetical protein